MLTDFALLVVFSIIYLMWWIVSTWGIQALLGFLIVATCAGTALFVQIDHEYWNGDDDDDDPDPFDDDLRY